MTALSDEQLAAKTDAFRDRLDAGESEEGLLEEVRGDRERGTGD
jgi:preprotein translocase subunit SecA